MDWEFVCLALDSPAVEFIYKRTTRGVYLVSSSSSFLTLRRICNLARRNTATSATAGSILKSSNLTMTASADLNMILRDLSAFNMGRGAYDTTGVKKPGAPPPPPK